MADLLIEKFDIDYKELKGYQVHKRLLEILIALEKEHNGDEIKYFRQYYSDDHLCEYENLMNNNKIIFVTRLSEPGYIDFVLTIFKYLYENIEDIKDTLKDILNDYSNKEGDAISFKEFFTLIKDDDKINVIQFYKNGEEYNKEQSKKKTKKKQTSGEIKSIMDRYHFANMKVKEYTLHDLLNWANELFECEQKQ